MSDRIDHAAEARELIEAERRPSPAGWETADAQHLANFMEAQAHATLALMDAQREANEQARIGNLIALCGSDVEVNMIGRAVSFEALGVREKVGTPENGFIRWHLHPDIAAALGLEGEPS